MDHGDSTRVRLAGLPLRDRLGALPRRRDPRNVPRHRSIRAENGVETVALQRHFGWKAIDTALAYVHLSGRHVLDAARPALPVGHV